MTRARRARILSLGSVLYHAVTGLRPFEGPNVFAVLDAISRIDPPLPSALKQGLPAALDTLLGRLLAKPAEDRTLDAMQVARALRSVKVSLADGVTAITAGARETARNKAPFVGRAHELGRLTAALSHAVAGDGTTLVITGDAGMGKTALLDTFLRARQTLAANALVCRGQSVEVQRRGRSVSADDSTRWRRWSRTRARGCTRLSARTLRAGGPNFLRRIRTRRWRRRCRHRHGSRASWAMRCARQPSRGRW